MVNKVFFFDSHPVQYKAPVYQALSTMLPNGFEVIYATDASVRRGNFDREFGNEVMWDTPLLDGYPYRVLGNENGVPMAGRSSLTGTGIFSLLRRERPRAVVLTQMYYRFDHVAYLSALALRIPILIRQETQDEMYAAQRSAFKRWTRYAVYRTIYRPVRHAFAFGQLNHAHLARHGIAPDKISFARFSVPNPIEHLSATERAALRQRVRVDLGVGSDKILVAFFGKLIPKKNPDLLFQALSHVSSTLRNRLHLLFVGSGNLMGTLTKMALSAQARFGLRASFTGFVNQSQLPPYYLATDILVLPSRRMGEAWGLVVNEALQAGCSVVVSEAVGCHPEFGHLDRVRVIPVGGAVPLAEALQSLSAHSRELYWADDHMRRYSSGAAAAGIKVGIEPYLSTSRPCVD